MARRMVEVENVNHPDQVRLVDAVMDDAMRRVLLKVLPKTPPGLTVEDIYAKVARRLPEDLFPSGAPCHWPCSERKDTEPYCSRLAMSRSSMTSGSCMSSPLTSLHNALGFDLGAVA
jgi:hypothetical protein